MQYDRLTLDDGTELPISQSYRRVVRGRLLRWTPGGWCYDRPANRLLPAH
ncbi:hypothetical protein M5E87_07005 [Flavonifractor plautii]|nr:hypothetical protein M5E87_07005 [Flavonifractor plautii]